MAATWEIGMDEDIATKSHGERAGPVATDDPVVVLHTAELKKQLAVLESVLSHVNHGISLFNRDLELDACNSQYLDMLGFPAALGVPGTPFEAFIRYNALRGEYGPGDVDAQVNSRVELARKRQPHHFERTRPEDGTTLEITGTPLPNGGFVTTYSDITQRKQYEDQLELALQVARLGMFQWKQSAGTIALDPKNCAALGYGAENTQAPMPLELFVHPSDLPRLLQARDAYLQGGSPISVEVRIRNATDAFTWVRLGAGRKDSVADTLLGVFTDISEQKAADENLARTANRLTTLMGSLPDIVLSFDVSSTLTNVHVPRNADQAFSIENWQGRPYGDVLPAPIAAAIESALVAAWEQTAPQTHACQLQTGNGTRHYDVTVTQLSENTQWPTGFIVVLRDVTEARDAEEKLKLMAYRDPLTDLPNRRLLDDRLSLARDKSARSRNQCALLLIDLNKFKAVNDTYGHDAGDSLLQQVAHQLRVHLRASDTVARIGGDEFAVVVEELGTEPEGAELNVRKVIEKLQAAMKDEFDLGVVRVNISGSIGYTLFSGVEPPINELFISADRAMYREKACR